MKNLFITFLNKPAQVAGVSVITALLLGFFGYQSIHRLPPVANIPENQNSTGDSLETGDVTLGFLLGGRINSVRVKVGDTVDKGQVLATLEAGNAAGVLSQAKAAYAAAQANLDKVINGASGPQITVARAALTTAEVNLAAASKQQDTLVSNARRTLLSSSLAAKATSGTGVAPPTISGTYTGDIEGVMHLNVYQAGSGILFSLSGLATGTGQASTTVAQPLGSTGLSVLFPGGNYDGTSWDILIPNTEASTYVANANAYQIALETRTQTLATLTATRDQAKAALDVVVSAARPEDVATAHASVENARGALQVAEAAFANTQIVAPFRGLVATVFIAPGQIAVPNAPAIEVIAQSGADTK
jgi:HlyD family secretion protein